MSILDPTQESESLPNSRLVDLDDITPDESLLAEVRKTRVTTPFTRVLLGLMVLSVGFLGGALVDRWQRPSSGASSNLQSLAAQFRNRGGAGASGASGASGAGSGTTIGTVKLVDGTNVYVQDAQGNVIKVTTNGNTQVTVSKTGTVSQLEPGSAVTVQGKQSSDGTSMAATSISPSSGFGRGGFFGAGGTGG